MNAKAFIIFILMSLQIRRSGDLLPAIGRLYHNASLIWYNVNSMERYTLLKGGLI